MKCAKVFLSYSTKNTELVKNVANALCRRGIIPWLDIEYLHAGETIKENLEKAIKDQTAFVFFLSDDSAISDWVKKDELKIAVDIEKKGEKDFIIPVIIEKDAIDQLFKNFPDIKGIWAIPDSKRINKKCILLPEDMKECERAESIARDISRALFEKLGFKKEENINIAILQRGGEKNPEESILPREVKSFPTLFFRPHMEERGGNDTLFGDDWINWFNSMKESLSDALKPLEGKKIHIMGLGQLGIFFSLGKLFNYSNHVKLYCYDRDHRKFTTKKKNFIEPIKGENPDCIQWEKPVQPDDKAFGLYIGRNDYKGKVEAHINSLNKEMPYGYIETKEINTSEQANTLIGNVVVALEKVNFKKEKRIYLYTSLPAHVLPLLSANLLYVGKDIVFMELRRDLTNSNSNNIYVELPMD